jgi:hypothetical protein
MVCEHDHKPEIQAQLTVNGQEIELNDFIQDLLGRAVIGMIGSLKGVTDPRAVTLNISKPTQ